MDKVIRSISIGWIIFIAIKDSLELVCRMDQDRFCILMGINILDSLCRIRKLDKESIFTMMVVCTKENGMMISKMVVER